ncbi:MAG: ribonuclease HI [Bacteroidia bacterium]|nr:ribonuclease HI [Bacteroidia bacterium]
MSNQIIEIFTDGSSLGNPGPGGYGIVMKYGAKQKRSSEGYRLTTNNRMELMAVIQALKMLNDVAKEKEVIIYSDSKYVIHAVEKKWVFGWVKKNFKDKANADLWRMFLKEYSKYNIKFHWVKGHSGHTENEICDKLAKKAAEGKPLKTDHGYESSKNNSNQLF